MQHPRRASVGLAGAGAQLILNGVISNTNDESHNEWPFTGGNHRYYSGNMNTNIPADPSRYLFGLVQ